MTIKAVGQGLLAPKKVVLLGSAGVKHSQTARNQAYKVVAKTGKVITSLPGLSLLQGRLKKALYRSAGSQDYLHAGAMKQIFLNTINEDLQTDAAHITQPCLLIWGANDDQTPVGDAKLLAGVISHATLQVVPNAGHFVQLDAPQQVEKLVDGFLE